MDNYVLNTLPLYNNSHHLVPDCQIIIQTIWNAECIDMSLYLNNDKKGFTGTILTSTLSTIASTLEINLSEFMGETRSVLCTENGLSNFTYYFESKTFKWCKAVEGFRITYGSVILEDRDNLIEEMMVSSIGINRFKDEKISALYLDIQRMDDSFSEMKVTLEKCVDEKNRLENEMLKKFAALLNSKKKKIAELQKVVKNHSTVDDCESDGSGDDSDLDYSSQMYVCPKSPTPSTSNQQANNHVVVPKRVKLQPETIVNLEQIQRSNSTDSTDIYDRETELLMDDM